VTIQEDLNHISIQASPRELDNIDLNRTSNFLDSSKVDIQPLQDINFDKPLPEDLTFGNLDEPHANP
jgi:hypothetical protein